MADKGKALERSSSSEIDAFLKKTRELAPTGKGGGRLLFALDATASRESVWDRAMQIQSEMFLAASKVGNLSIKLAYYRGFMECYALPWTPDAADLLGKMTGIHCAAGATQIERILNLALKEHAIRPIDALVFVGDCMEENPDRLADLAGQLGLVGVPMFIFQDRHDAIAEKTFRHMATLSKGAWCRFDANSAAELRDLLCGVAVYAAGGRKALEAFSHNRGDALKRLSHQVRN
ncbi:MAG: hypothetical protein DHS20C01_10780 [marine bacterium B5-7]|nr:MAG: hypothetical protein DHS20C01_10780 [marine bacterium B5-7]